MTSNNETVSCQILWAGNIAKSMTSEGSNVLLPANADCSQIFFFFDKFVPENVGYITNRLKTGPEENS